MLYSLMHKDVEVMHIDIDDDGWIAEVNEIVRADHVPLGGMTNGSPDNRAVSEWWNGRSIPASRSGIRDVLETLGIGTTRALLTKSMGLSLSDQYWVRPVDSDVSWKDINFFQNPFSEDIGDLLFGNRPANKRLDLSSPDCTTVGNLKKRWEIVDGERCLVKGGTLPYCREVFNEVIASIICDALRVEHVPYGIVREGRLPYSICPDFVTPDTELIPAAQVMNVSKRGNSESVYSHYIRCCGMLECDVREQVDGMIVLDYLIANTDRHLNNFGLIRDADTLEFLGAAPLYDNGSSLGFDQMPESIGYAAAQECKPFAGNFERSLNLVTSLDWVDIGALRSSMEKIEDVIDASEGRMSGRKDETIAFISGRIDGLEASMEERRRWSAGIVRSDRFE